MNYILFDLEAVGTCKSGDFMEIIEIAAYKVVVKDDMTLYTEYMKRNYIPQCLILDSYHTYIKPIFHPVINKKINKLTGVDTKMLISGKYYYDAIEEFIEWAGKDAIFVAWSDNDREMIELNNKKHFIPEISLLSYLDLQDAYDKAFKKAKRTSLATAIQEIGADFDGKPHNAMDDAINMIPIFQNIIKHGTIII